MAQDEIAVYIWLTGSLICLIACWIYEWSADDGKCPRSMYVKEDERGLMFCLVFVWPIALGFGIIALFVWITTNLFAFIVEIPKRLLKNGT